MGDDLQAELDRLVRIVELFPGVDLDQFVQAHHADQVGHPVHAQIRGAVLVHGQKGQGAVFAEGQELLDKGLLFSRWAFTALLHHDAPRILAKSLVSFPPLW